MSFLDGMRDAGIVRASGIGWHEWHVIKWLSFYLAPIMICLVFLRGQIKWTGFILLVAAAWFMWQVGCGWIGPAFYRAIHDTSYSFLLWR